MSSAYTTICSSIPWLCNIIIEMIADDEPEYENAERLPVLMSHYPSGSSSKNFEEVMQL